MNLHEAVRLFVYRLFWLWGPPLALIAEQAVFYKDYQAFDWVFTEAGVVENATALLLAAAVFFGIRIVRHRDRLPNRRIRV